jgi:hypothetical protein
MTRFLAVLVLLIATAAHAEENADFFDFKEPSIPLTGHAAWGAGTGSGSAYVSWRKWSNAKRAFEYRLGLSDSGNQYGTSPSYDNSLQITPAFAIQRNLLQSGQNVLVQWTCSVSATYSQDYMSYRNIQAYSVGGGLFTGPAVEIFLPVFHNLSLSGSTGIGLNYVYRGNTGYSSGVSQWQLSTQSNGFSPWTLALNMYY